MAVMLITALQAAETLATFHRQRVEQTLGSHQDYHRDMAQRCADDIARIKEHLADGGAHARCGSGEDQDC